MSDDLIHGTELRVCVSSQEPSVMTEDDNGSDNSQFTGSTINLQDLEWASRCRLLMDLTLHSLHQQNTPPSQDSESIFGHVGERGGHELTDKCTLRRRNESLLISISEAHFCTKIKHESNPVSRIMWGTLSLCVQWVLTVTVSIPWCHIATHAHTVCCLCSSCLTDTSRCAFLHWVICFICCYYDLICSGFLLDLFLYCSSKTMLKTCLSMCLYTSCNELLPYCHNFICLLFII